MQSNCAAGSHQHFESCRFSFLRFPVLRSGRLRVLLLMERQARRTEYAVAEAAFFRVRFAQLSPAVKALRAGCS
jgi:hypothetical protein